MQIFNIFVTDSTVFDPHIRGRYVIVMPDHLLQAITILKIGKLRGTSTHKAAGISSLVKRQPVEILTSIRLLRAAFFVILYYLCYFFVNLFIRHSCLNFDIDIVV